MDLAQFSHNLKIAGIDSKGIEYWLECLNSAEITKKHFEAGAHENHPMDWYNLKLTTFVRSINISLETRAYIYMAFLKKLIPAPDKITSWPEMRALILQTEQSTRYSNALDQRLPINADFISKFEQRSACTLEEWKWEQIHGNICGLIATIIRLCRQSGPIFLKWCLPYTAMLDRLFTPASHNDSSAPLENGLLSLTSHCRFHAEHTKQTKQKFGARAFVVTGQMVKDETTKSILPILMLKAIKSKKLVYVAVDGGKGNLNLESTVFGSKIYLPSSFSWVYWKTHCECNWNYLVANEAASGTHLHARDISLPEKDKPDYETFCEKFTQKLGKEIETSMIDHPFSFGSYQHVGRDLLRP